MHILDVVPYLTISGYYSGGFIFCWVLVPNQTFLAVIFQRLEQLTSHCEDAVNLLQNTISKLESTVLPPTAEVLQESIKYFSKNSSAEWSQKMLCPSPFQNERAVYCMYSIYLGRLFYPMFLLLNSW